MMIARLTAIWTAIAMAIALLVSAPAAAQDSPGSYRQELDSIYLDMRALWGEIERFEVKKRYCRPPLAPLKAVDQATLAALGARADALNQRYRRVKQGLRNFLARNPRIYAELLVNNIDPRNPRWWTRYDGNRDRMLQELNAKRNALAAAPEVNCAQAPKPQPPATAGFQAPDTPQRPSYEPLNWPPLPKHFCSLDEYWDFIINKINPLYLKAADNAYAAARFRTQVSRAINAHVQNDQPVPEALRALDRQAAADVREQNRLSAESEAIRRRAKAIPVIDCTEPQAEPPRQDMRTGQAPPRAPKPQLPGVGSDEAFDVGRQQQYIDGFEADIRKLGELRRQGRCVEMLDLVDELDEELDILDGYDGPGLRIRGGLRRPLIPPRLIDEWDRKIDEAIGPCPHGTLGMPTIGTIYVPPRGSVEWRLLEAHNRERALVGVPLLRWDPELARGAAAYAPQLSLRGLAHAPREGRKDVRENLLQSNRGGRSIEQMIGVWIAEKRYFVPGVFPNVSSTGNWYDVGHYSQMIWPTTSRLGCAIHSDARFDWLVCRYSPPGNRDGTRITNDYRGARG